MILFIDSTDNDLIQIGLLLGEKFATKQWRTKFLSKTLLPQISSLLKKYKHDFSDIKKIVVVRGPGFFSRTRSGIATANALAYALGIPMAGVKASQVPKDFQKLDKLKWQKIVLPYYEKAPNITIRSSDRMVGSNDPTKRP